MKTFACLIPRNNALCKTAIPVLILALLFSSFTVFSAVFRKAPYLLYPKSNIKTEICWQLYETADCTVDYGFTTSYGTTVTSTEYGTDHQHKVQLSGLNVNTKYYYQVNIIGGTSVTGSFMTGAADNATEVSFYAYGDTRSQPDIHNSVCSRIVQDYAANPSSQTFIIVSGDLVSTGDLETAWDGELFRAQDTEIRAMMGSLPYMASMGNHEGQGLLFEKYFPYQFNNGKHYYSFDYGPAHFTVIDQYDTYTSGSTQYNWIVSDLSGSTKPWKFILLHEPGWSAGGGHGNNTTVQSVLQPLAETYGVQFFIAGHNHYYARATVNNIQHITAGGGGAPLHTPDPSYPYVVTADRSYNFCKINISEDHLDFAATRSDGSLIESFSLVRNLSVNLTSPVKNSTYTAPASVSLSATASDNSKVQKVDFYSGSTLIGTDTSAPYTWSWNNVPAGSYTITAKATDWFGASVSSSPAAIVVYDPVLPNTVSRIIASGTDDAEESSTRSVNTTSTDMELVTDGTMVQTVGLRFINLLIPHGAIITNAYIQFTCDEMSTGTCSLSVRGEKTASSATFSTTSGNISGRTKTSASVAWSPPDWGSPGASGVNQRTTQLAPVIQEIVNLSAFTTTSPITIIITGTGRRTAWAYDGNTAAAANLVVEFTLQPPVTPAFAQIGPLCQNSVPPSLNLVSTNGITGTWSPSVINTSSPGSMVYTFTPNAGQNATTVTMTITVNLKPAAPSVSLTQPTCAQATGTVTVTSPIGSGITYSIGGAYQLSSVFNGLNSGSYTVTVKNEYGCISAGTPAAINPQPVTPAAPVIGTITQPTCASSTGSVELTGLPAGNWTINPGNISGNTSVTIISNLVAGTCNFTVTNFYGCTSGLSADVTITAPVGSPENPSLQITQPTCTEATGSITVLSPTSPEMTYSIGGAYQTSVTFSGLLSGNYTVTAKNSFGCISAGSPATINVQPLTPVVTNSPLMQTITSGSVTALVTLTSNVPGTTFAWTASGSAGLSGYATNGTSTIPVQLISNPGTSAGTVTYAITPTANGCTGPVTNYIITVNPAPVSHTLDKMIISGTDDAEEYNAGTVVLEEPDLELVYKSKTTGNQKVGLRFTGVSIPKGATIVSAAIQFTASTSGTGTANLTVQGQAADNPTFFTKVKKNISSRIKTSASVPWKPGNWTAGNSQVTSELKTIVQELVNRNGWTEGNSMVFIISGTGTRVAASYEKPLSTPAKLHIEYLQPAAGSDAIAGKKAVIRQEISTVAGILTCYPVPLTDKLQIRFTPSGEEDLKYLEIYSASGVLLKRFENPENEIQVSSADLVPGIYLIRVQTDRNRYVKTVVKR